MDVSVFHKIGNARGLDGLKSRSARGVLIHGETPLRLDNIGKKCRVPLIYTL